MLRKSEEKGMVLKVNGATDSTGNKRIRSHQFFLKTTHKSTPENGMARAAVSDCVCLFCGLMTTKNNQISLRSTWNTEGISQNESRYPLCHVRCLMKHILAIKAYISLADQGIIRFCFTSSNGMDFYQGLVLYQKTRQCKELNRVCDNTKKLSCSTLLF